MSPYAENLLTGFCVILFTIIIFVVIIFLGLKKCEQETTLVNSLPLDKQTEVKYGISKVEYEDHTYIIMCKDKYLNGICHDENCKCKWK